LVFSKKGGKIILKNLLRKAEFSAEFTFAELTLIRIMEAELKMQNFPPFFLKKRVKNYQKSVEFSQFMRKVLRNQSELPN